MKIAVNGADTEVSEGISVAQLLESLGIKAERVAVEVNLLVVRREQRSGHELKERDQVEIVSFVGGGA